MRDSFGYWIREVGVDAFRVDTAFYVPPDYFQDFMRSRDRCRPRAWRWLLGAPVAQRFHVFGEGFGIDKPYQDKESDQD